MGWFMVSKDVEREWNREAGVVTQRLVDTLLVEVQVQLSDHFESLARYRSSKTPVGARFFPDQLCLATRVGHHLGTAEAVIEQIDKQVAPTLMTEVHVTQLARLRARVTCARAMWNSEPSTQDAEPTGLMSCN